MSQANLQPTTSRRNFLVRALGAAAAGTVVSVPVIAAESARGRIERLKVELAAALGDEYGADAIVNITDNVALPAHVREGSIGCITATVRV